MQADTFGQRIWRFLVLVGLVSGLVFGVVAAQRLSSDALALLWGVFLGALLLGVPVVLAAFVGLRVWMLTRRPARSEPALTVPPIIVQMPASHGTAQLPDYGLPWDVPQRQRPAPRAWDVIGGEE